MVRRWWAIAGMVAMLAVPYGILLKSEAEHSHLPAEQSLCPFKMLTGFPCPGCGITKSLVYFYQGDLYKSMYYHVLGPFVVLFCVATIVLLLTELITKKEYLNELIYNKKLAYILAFFLIFYQIVRITYFVENNTYDSILKESIWK